MGEGAGHTLYANKDRTVFYWVPNDLEFVEGPYELSTLTREKISVQEEAVVAFEIDEAQAKQLARQAVKRFTMATSQFIARSATALRELHENKPVTTDDQRAAAEDALGQVASTLGITPEQVRGDPEAVKEGFKGVIGGIQDALKDAVTPEGERSEASKERLEAMKRYATEELGADIGEKVEEWPEQIADALRNPELVEQAKQSADYLKQLAAEIRAGAVRAEEVMGEE